jgi:ABC-type nitrate/sulfonate/bicarbonate transport system permease component
MATELGTDKTLRQEGASTATFPDMRPAAPRIPGQPTRFSQYEALIIGMISVIVFFVTWQAVATARLVPPLFLPGPLDVVAAYGELIKGGKLWYDMWVSGEELFLGFGLAVIVALPLGVMMGWYRRLNYVLDPFVTFLYNSPRIALIPLFIVWFGIGIYSKIALVFLGAFFAILINTAVGIRNVDGALLKSARSFCASDAQIFRTVALPGSVPFVLTGLRLGVAHALIGVVVGELVAAQAGLGLMMATAGSTFQMSKVFAGVFIFAVAGMIFNYAILRLEKRFQSWRPDNRS